MKKRYSHFDHPLNLVFGIALERLREERGLSCWAAAKKAQVSIPQWYKLESGEHWPSVHTLGKICAALNIAPSEVFYLVADTLSQHECNANVTEYLKSVNGSVSG